MYDNILGIIIGYTPKYLPIFYYEHLLMGSLKCMNGIQLWGIMEKHGKVGTLAKLSKTETYMTCFLPELACVIGDEKYFERIFKFGRVLLPVTWNQVHVMFLLSIYFKNHNIARCIVDEVSKRDFDEYQYFKGLNNGVIVREKEFFYQFDKTIRIRKAFLMMEMHKFEDLPAVDLFLEETRQCSGAMISSYTREVMNKTLLVDVNRTVARGPLHGYIGT